MLELANILQAPSPRVLFTDKGLLDFDEEDPMNDDAFDGIDTDMRPIRYYRSEKTLGYLFRNIDEHQFLVDMQKQHRAVTSTKNQNVMKQVLAYMKKFASRYGIISIHHAGLAAEIRAR